jgi:hypothetical protein
VSPSYKEKTLGKERTKVREACQDVVILDRGSKEWETRSSAPDNALLIEKVVDNLDAITHLDLRLFGHGEDGTDQLA